MGYRFAGLLLIIAAATVAWPAMAAADTAEQKFHRAYYLEHEKGDMAAAAALYGKVAGSANANAALRADARVRQESCQEELASADFARLMLPNTLLYAELNKPGGQLIKLAEQLGMLRKNGEAPHPDQRVAISEAIFRELLGIRGAAIGITGFNPARGEPIGVVVAHAGDVEVLRGLIESALPVGGKKMESIEGFPTYNVEGKVFVTLTRRLVVASPQRAAIKNVVRRIKGLETSSILDNPILARALENRGEPLVFFCLNFQPLLPFIMAGAGMAAGQNPEIRMAQALVDLQSLETVSGKLGVTDDGIGIDLSLRLAEGHRNLVFNFLRFPPIDKGTLKQIPAGAAFFMAAALNTEDARLVSAGGSAAQDTPPPVTMLDIGREIFANIIGMSAYVVPTEGETLNGQPVPGVAVVLLVHDTAKSEALWTQMLGIGGMAAGGAMEGEPVQIDGVSARRYRFPEGVSIYFATSGRNIIITPSPTALSRSLATLKGGRSVLDDPAYAACLNQLDADTTLAAFVHPGRCAEIGNAYMSPRDRDEMKRFLPMLENTVASLAVSHSNRGLHLSAYISGLPNLGPVISDLVTMEQTRSEQRSQLASAMAKRDWDQALGIIDSQAEHRGGDTDLAWKRFKLLATGKKDEGAARACAKQLGEGIWNEANALNNHAWRLLTDESLASEYADIAMIWSKRSNELTRHSKWQYVDTLARGHFATGDAARAIEVQRKAIELCGQASGREAMEETLAQYEAAPAKAAKVGEVRF